jgi:hypothetical protein
MQHHLIDVRFKDGVYVRKEAVETFSHAENGYLAALEGRAVLEIGRAYGKPHPSIRCVLLPRGGIPPAARRRSRRVLTLAVTRGKRISVAMTLLG